MINYLGAIPVGPPRFDAFCLASCCIPGARSLAMRLASSEQCRAWIEPRTWVRRCWLVRWHGRAHRLGDEPGLTQKHILSGIGGDSVLGHDRADVVSVRRRKRPGRHCMPELFLLRVSSTGYGFPKACGPRVAASKLVAPNHDHHATGCLALRVVTPTATSQTSFLEKAAGLTLLLRHAFPQVRLPSRSGKTKPRASESNPFQAVPNSRPMFDAATQGMLLPQVRPDSTNAPSLCLSVTSLRVSVVRFTSCPANAVGKRRVLHLPVGFSPSRWSRARAFSFAPTGDPASPCHNEP